MTEFCSKMALSMMLIPIFLASCTMFSKTEDNSMTELADRAVKSHEDIEIDIKSTPQKK